ncbi:MAG: PIN domain-containing protein [Verrucomicrobiales bacterium]|nr:PIN domain-containing protein [Verrucomicrobiales bacterium]
MLDTNSCIYIINRSPKQVYDRLKKLSLGEVGISVITYCELQFGVAQSAKPVENQLALTEFLASLEVLDLPSSCAPAYGELRTNLKKKGRIIGNYDLLIASHALSEGLTLVSNNLKEFERVEGLSCENWM